MIVADWFPLFILYFMVGLIVCQVYFGYEPHQEEAFYDLPFRGGVLMSLFCLGWPILLYRIRRKSMRRR